LIVVAEFDFDLFVIGGGSGGVRAARIAAGHGGRVATAEEYRYGGTCVIRGCVPKKLLVFGSHFGEDFEDAAAYGWTVGNSRFDWPILIANKDREIDRLNGIYIRMLKSAGCHVLDGRAILTDDHTIEVGGRSFTAGTVLVATGGYPFVPDFPGMEHAITSNEAFHLPDMPRRVAIVGGGFIAVEFAGIFNGLGAETVQLYRGEQILRGFDREARDVVAREIVKKGIDLRCGTDVVRIEAQPGDTYRVALTDGSTLLVDKVMYATGRRPNTRDLGLEAAGVAVDEAGAIKVDEWSQTNVPHIYAVGDVTNRINLTPVALQEGHRFADAVFGSRKRSVDHGNVPSAVFSQPPLATVGLTEEEAVEQGGELDIFTSEFGPLRHTLTGRDEKSFMKLIVDAASDRVVGAHMVGADAAEIMQGIAIAVHAGLTKAQFDDTVGIHPTSAEEFVTLRQATRRVGVAAGYRAAE